MSSEGSGSPAKEGREGRRKKQQRSFTSLRGFGTTIPTPEQPGGIRDLGRHSQWAAGPTCQPTAEQAAGGAGKGHHAGRNTFCRPQTPSTPTGLRYQRLVSPGLPT